MSPALKYALLPLLIVATAPFALADDDDDEDEEEEHERRSSYSRREHEEHEEHEREEHGGRAQPAAGPSGVAPVTLSEWTSECGSCHMAYPPGMLPARSWDALLADLPHHFGDDATVAEPTRAALAAYATANAADVSNYRLSRVLARATEGTTPLRVSTIPDILSQHDEIPKSWFAEPDIRSRANCVACHPNAKTGSFREGEIRIPVHGGWDD